MTFLPGPDGYGQYRPSTSGSGVYVGSKGKSTSVEATNSTVYLWRSSKHMPIPRPKTSHIGEVGWGVQQLADWSAPNTGHQIQVSNVVRSYTVAVKFPN